MRTITIQPVEKGGKLPYPYHIKSNRSVARQEFWKGNPSELVGFAAKPKAGDIDLEFKDFWKNPELAIGTFPVFEKLDGSWFTLTDHIESVRSND